jgi:hypothetical protein
MLGRRRLDEGAIGNIGGDDGAGADDCALANGEQASARGGDHGAGANPRIVFDHHTPGAAEMSENHGAQSDLDAVANLDALGVFIFEVNVVADKNAATDTCTAHPMQERTQGPSAGQHASHQLQDAIKGSSRQVLFAFSRWHS